MTERRSSTNKVILITGASTGFGRTAAETLAQRGYRVFATMRDVTGRNTAVAEELRSQAKHKAWSLEVLEMDVTDDASVKQGVERALKRAGRIGVVINNAGIATLGITEAYSPAGERPFRTVPTASIQQFLEPYNAQAEQIRDTIALHVTRLSSRCF